MKSARTHSVGSCEDLEHHRSGHKPNLPLAKTHFFKDESAPLLDIAASQSDVKVAPEEQSCFQEDQQDDNLADRHSSLNNTRE